MARQVKVVNDWVKGWHERPKPSNALPGLPLDANRTNCTPANFQRFGSANLPRLPEGIMRRIEHEGADGFGRSYVHRHG
jgi:hypothetical protein